MSDYRVKLIATLSVDENKEKDLVDHIESLKERHKLGEFVTAALRVCWEHPEYLKESGYKGDTYGMTQERARFIQGISNNLSDLHKKVDAIYDMTVQLKTLAMMGKRLGLEQRSENSLRSAFLIQKQADELARLLGVSTLQPVWASNKMEIEQKKVEDIIETIITSYDGIIGELVESQTVAQRIIKESEVNEVHKLKESVADKVIKSESCVENTSVPADCTVVNEVSIGENMDMSDADWDMLDAFVGA